MSIIDSLTRTQDYINKHYSESTSAVDALKEFDFDESTALGKIEKRNLVETAEYFDKKTRDSKIRGKIAHDFYIAIQLASTPSRTSRALNGS